MVPVVLLCARQMSSPFSSLLGRGLGFWPPLDLVRRGVPISKHGAPRIKLPVGVRVDLLLGSPGEPSSTRPHEPPVDTFFSLPVIATGDINNR